MQTKQLYYKSGRRYKEFVPPREVNDTLYYLDSGEYVPLCQDTMSWYMGRPSDGVWLVRDGGKSASWIGDFNTSPSRLSVEEHRELILKAITEALKKSDGEYISHNGIATYILDGLAKYTKPTGSPFNENVILYYTNWMNKQTGKAPTNEQIESFKKDSLEMIKIYMKKGYELKDAFNKVVNGYNR